MPPHDNAPRPPSADPRDLAGPFRHATSVEVRFADTDGRGHVNNAVYLTYCEIGRLRYWSDVTGEAFDAGSAESLILAEARITYRAPVIYGEVVMVQTRATRIGRSSFTLEHRLSAAAGGAEPRLVAVSESVLVRYDYTDAVPIALPEAYVASIEAYEGRSLRT